MQDRLISGCRIGATLTLDDLAETSEIGDWKMPDFRAACTYAVSQGWLIVEDDTLTDERARVVNPFDWRSTFRCPQLNPTH